MRLLKVAQTGSKIKAQVLRLVCVLTAHCSVLVSEVLDVSKMEGSEIINFFTFCSSS